MAGSSTGGTDAVSPEVLVSISAATRAREVLRFDYASGDPAAEADPAPPRHVEPHHLVTANGRWYVVAWDLEHDDWRFFRADRLALRRATGPRFSPREIPGGDVAECVSARFKGPELAQAFAQLAVRNAAAAAS